MRLRENMMAIFNTLRQDENLLRLLFYKAEHMEDDVLVVTTERPKITDMEPWEVWEIVNDRIKNTPKVDDLDSTEKCRILFYPEERRPDSNYLVATQTVVFDVLTPFSFQNDFRNEWICDQISTLLQSKRITGINKSDFKRAGQISAPKGYIGFRMQYTFGSTK